MFWSLLLFYRLSFHTCCYPALSFLLAILLAGWSLRSRSGRSQFGGQAATALLPGSACSPRLGWVPGAAWGQWEHFGGVRAAELWFFCLWVGTCSHFTLTFTGFHPAPEGSVSRDLAQNREITDISLNGNTVTILHLDHLISAAWHAMKHSESWAMKLQIAFTISFSLFVFKKHIYYINSCYFLAVILQLCLQ